MHYMNVKGRVVVMIALMINVDMIFASAGSSSSSTTCVSTSAKRLTPESGLSAKEPAKRPCIFGQTVFLKRFDKQGHCVAQEPFNFNKNDLLLQKPFGSLLAGRLQKGLPWIVARVQLFYASGFETEVYADGLHWHRFLQRNQKAGNLPVHPTLGLNYGDTIYSCVEIKDQKCETAFLGADEDVCKQTVRGRLICTLMKDTQNWLSLLKIGSCYYKLGQCDKAVGWYKKAADALKNASQPYGRVLEKIGSIYEQLGDLEGAIEAYREAVPVLKQEEKDYAGTLLRLGCVYLDNKQYQEAQPVFAERVLILKKNNSPRADDLTTLGYVCELQGDIFHAHRHYLKALKQSVIHCYALANLLYVYATAAAQCSRVSESLLQSYVRQQFDSTAQVQGELSWQNYQMSYPERFYVAIKEASRLLNVQTD